MNMEKQNTLFAGNNKDKINLPIGYRFRPTDEELVVHYLKRKVFGLPLPASVIPDLDVFRSHPSALPGDMKEKKRYFFSSILTSSGSKCKPGSGYWKHVGRNRQISASGSNNSKQVVGIRTTLVFRQGKHDTKTQWMMHEYHLVGIVTNPNSPFPVPKMVMMGDWVVRGIFQRKKKKAKKKHGGVSWNRIQASDIIRTRANVDDDEAAASSCSSEITAVDELLSPNVVTDQEESSACDGKIEASEF